VRSEDAQLCLRRLDHCSATREGSEKKKRKKKKRKRKRTPRGFGGY
jgi:hypothetical protein